MSYLETYIFFNRYPVTATRKQSTMSIFFHPESQKPFAQENMIYEHKYVTPLLKSLSPTKMIVLILFVSM